MDVEHFIKYKNVYSTRHLNLIAQEFCRLKENCYLDHAGSTLYSEKQIQNVFTDYASNIYSNPHARNVVSKSTEDGIDIIRYQVLDHFNTNNEEYSVIFTSGATAALKIIAECFDYGESTGTFTYLENNHTSVLGMRNFAKNVIEVKANVAFKILTKSKPPTEINAEENDQSNSLFVYPAQCNFSGTKYPLTWIESVKTGILNCLIEEKSKNWYVVLDCASYISTNDLDLSKHKPDFIPISFYKVFGYPTGLGALLVKRSSEQLLIKKYFGGGTVLMALSSNNLMVPRINLHERFEDGTLPFLSILAIKHGFDTIKRLNLNFDIISRHTFSLARYVYRNLSVLHHSNGHPAAILYQDTNFENRDHQGGIVNFNLLRSNGEFIGYSEVLHISNLHGISIRTGCFCNPGACQRFLKLTASDVITHFNAGHVCGDQHDLVNNYPTGSVRISFGYMSTQEDANRFLNMIESCFVSKPVVKKLPSNWHDLRKNYEELFYVSDKNKNFSQTSKIVDVNTEKCSGQYVTANCIENVINETDKLGILEQILVYPVKSCGAFSVTDNWPITSTGLKYDREWMVTGPNGVCLTQKHNRKLCLIKPEINLKRNILKLQFKGNGQSDIEISLAHPSDNEISAYLCQSKVCGDRIQGWDCGDAVSEWLSINLEIPGLRLLHQCNTTDILGRISTKDTTRQLSLANKAQYLLLNSASVQWLMQKVPSDDLKEDANSVILRFRPNFVVNFTRPFHENQFDAFLFNDVIFKSSGKCTRCQMICINQNTGEISKEPFHSLSREFKGKVNFGIYLNQDVPDREITLSLGSNVIGKNNYGQR